MQLRLYILRHGETAWSLSIQHTGRADNSLTSTDFRLIPCVLAICRLGIPEAIECSIPRVLSISSRRATMRLREKVPVEIQHLNRHALFLSNWPLINRRALVLLFLSAL